MVYKNALLPSIAHISVHDCGQLYAETHGQESRRMRVSLQRCAAFRDADISKFIDALWMPL